MPLVLAPRRRRHHLRARKQQRGSGSCALQRVRAARRGAAACAQRAARACCTPPRKCWKLLRQRLTIDAVAVDMQRCSVHAPGRAVKAAGSRVWPCMSACARQPAKESVRATRSRPSVTGERLNGQMVPSKAVPRAASSPARSHSLQQRGDAASTRTSAAPRVVSVHANWCPVHAMRRRDHS
jgi:hypothetical protein